MEILFHILDFTKEVTGFALTTIMYYSFFRYFKLIEEREELKKFLDVVVGVRKDMDMEMSDDEKVALDVHIDDAKKELAKPLDVHAPHEHPMIEIYKHFKNKFGNIK